MIEMNKKYKTKDGKDVRILCIDRKGDYPVVGIVTGEDSSESIKSWTKEGLFVYDGSSCDLTEVKEIKKHTGWINIYKNDYNDSCATGNIHNTKQEADLYIVPNRIACIKIEFEDGEGIK